MNSCFYSLKKGFTLVELIVVISIVGILSTIGFVSYSSYLVGTRDTNRLGQIANISQALQVYGATNRLPLPDDFIEIQVNGDAVAYQGTAWVNVLSALDYNNGWKDPKENTYFTYMVSKDRKAFQLLTFMEESTSLSSYLIREAYANSYEDRFAKTYGNKLGILTSGSTGDGTYNTPANLLIWVTAIDLITTSDDYIAYYSDFDIVEGDNSVLRYANPYDSCKRLKESGLGLDSNIYSINPSGAGEKIVYCDMETSWGGWLLIARSEADGSGTFTWGADLWNIQNLREPYSLDVTSDYNFTQVMMATYNIKRRVLENYISDTTSLSSFSDGTYTLNQDGLSWGLSGQGMMFVR